MTLLVFTDLDGSLMEHETYSFAAARPALHDLQQRGFPLVMNSSKTSAEIENLRSELDLSTPYICENGAALMRLDTTISDQAAIVFGSPVSQWLEKLHDLRRLEGYQFEGFSDWSQQQICELTGLQADAAALARNRQYSEPILWRDSTASKSRFEQQVQAMDLRLIEGGRFTSVQGKHDKSDAMIWMREHYPVTDELITVALGDSPNDSAMLNAADIAVIIKSPKSERIELHAPRRVIRTTRPGPAGWQDAMQEILDLYDRQLLLPNTE